MSNLISPYPTTNGLCGQTYDGLSAVNGLIVDGAYLDGSWELCVDVEDTTVNVRVRGDMSLGGLMHLIVETVDIKQSWSDHVIWWPQRNMWLLHTKTSLDQYGVQSDARLVFRRTHGNLQLVLPSLATLILRVNYANRVFSVVDAICKELCIRHSEELSLMFPIKRENLKFNQPLPVIRHGSKKTGPLTSFGRSRSEMPSHLNTINGTLSTSKLNVENVSLANYQTLPYGSTTLMRQRSVDSLDNERLDVGKFADCSQRREAKTVFTDDWLLKPKNIQQKARMDGSWLDSSRSLMEHGIEPPCENDVYADSTPTLYLKFKYYSFYDLNNNYDAVRIHQLYEQARWSLLAGILECTEDEMVAFAAYQLQAEFQTKAASKNGFHNVPAGSGTLGRYRTLGGASGYNTMGSLNEVGSIRPITPDYSTNARIGYPRSIGESLLRLHSPNVVSSNHLPSPLNRSVERCLNADEDEIETLLTELEQSCNITRNTYSKKPHNSKYGLINEEAETNSSIPVLQNSIKIFRDRVFLLRKYKEMWAVLKDGVLMLYKDAHSTDQALMVYTLRDCLLSPDVSVANMRFVVKLSFLLDQNLQSGTISSGGRKNRTREEVWFKFSSTEEYAKWVAAFRLCSRGKLFANRTVYDKEVEIHLNLLQNQANHTTPNPNAIDLTNQLSDLSNFCAERIIKKAKSKDFLRQRISEVYSGIRDLTLLESKMRYIQDWQRLNHFGRSYFVVQFDRDNNFGLGANNNGLFSSSPPLEDILAVRQGRIEVISQSSDETIMAWNFTDLRSWNVNWDNGRVILEFRNGGISFKPLTANCKTVVELIGGYVFLSQRTPEKNQKIDERLFHKLTGAND